MKKHRSAGAWIAQAVCLAAILLIGPIHAQSGQPIYSYMDERGNLVATDRLDDIPERYRSAIKVTEGIAVTPRSGDKRGSLKVDWSEQGLLDLIDRLPPGIIPGLSTYQSVMVIGGLLAMLLFYGAAKLADSAFLRLLMPWAVGFIAFATIYTMFVSDLSDKVAAHSPDKSTGSLVHRFSEKGKFIGDQEQKHLKRIDESTRQP